MAKLQPPYAFLFDCIHQNTNRSRQIAACKRSKAATTNQYRVACVSDGLPGADATQTNSDCIPTVVQFLLTNESMQLNGPFAICGTSRGWTQARLIK
jgi:hypothetical protein